MCASAPDAGRVAEPCDGTAELSQPLVPCLRAMKKLLAASRLERKLQTLRRRTQC